MREVSFHGQTSMSPNQSKLNRRKFERFAAQFQPTLTSSMRTLSSCCTMFMICHLNSWPKGKLNHLMLNNKTNSSRNFVSTFLKSTRQELPSKVRKSWRYRQDVIAAQLPQHWRTMTQAQRLSISVLIHRDKIWCSSSKARRSLPRVSMKHLQSRSMTS